MKASHRIERLALGITCACALAAPQAGAQGYPAKPIRVVFGFSPGGAGDVSARLFAQKMRDELGQPVVVENRAGAGGAIADEHVAKSPPDGYTLLYIAGSATALPSLRTKLPYDVQRDLAPITLAVVTSFALSVHPSVPVRDAQGLIAIARSSRNRLTFSSPGVGSSAYLAGELFNMMAKARMLHVPFKGAPEAATAVAAGQVDVGFPSVTGVIPLAAAGKLRPLGVTSAKRSPLLPQVPALDEAGLPGYRRNGWNGFLAPAGTPPETIARLNGALVKIVNAPEMRSVLIKLGYEPQTTTPEQFAEFIRSEIAQSAKLIQFAGIQVQ